jgi:hypothetical protein
MKKVKAAKKGALFSLQDFEKFGSYELVKRTVNNLVKRQYLKQVYRGIYQKPNYSEFLRMYVEASPEEIAKKYAEMKQWKIAPAGDMALNILGLDTQVPNNYKYISNGPTRKIKIDNGVAIHFRNVSQREADMNEISSLVIEALKQVGKENITDSLLRKIRGKLTDQQFQQLRKDSSLSRIWIKEYITKMGEVDV